MKRLSVQELKAMTPLELDDALGRAQEDKMLSEKERFFIIGDILDERVIRFPKRYGENRVPHALKRQEERLKAEAVVK